MDETKTRELVHEAIDWFKTGAEDARRDLRAQPEYAAGHAAGLRATGNDTSYAAGYTWAVEEANPATDDLQQLVNDVLDVEVPGWMDVKWFTAYDLTHDVLIADHEATFSGQAEADLVAATQRWLDAHRGT